MQMRLQIAGFLSLAETGLNETVQLGGSNAAGLNAY